MEIRTIEKALTAKGYKLIETDKLVDDFTKLIARKNTFNNLPVVIDGGITTVYELNRTSRINYYFQNNENIFEIKNIYLRDSSHFNSTGRKFYSEFLLNELSIN